MSDLYQKLNLSSIISESPERGIVININGTYDVFGSIHHYFCDNDIDKEDISETEIQSIGEVIESYIDAHKNIADRIVFWFD